MRRILGLMAGLLMLISAASPMAAASVERTIHGTVTNQAGRPLQGAEVEVYRLGAGLVGVQSIGSDGTFEVSVLGPVGTLLQMRVWAQGYRTYETGWFDPAAQRRHAIRLAPIHGALEISVRDQDGGRLDGTAVLTGPGSVVVAEGNIRHGRLKFDGLEARQYRLVVMAAGYPDIAETVTIRADSVVTRSLTLTRPDTAVTGQVKNAVMGNPLAEAVVAVETSYGIQVAEASTNALGLFRLSLNPGSDSYRLRVSAPGYQMETRESVELEAGRGLDFSGKEAIALQPLTGALAGVLVNHHGSSLIGMSLLLYLQGYGEVSTTKSDNHGEFRFDDLPAGPGLRYRIIADEVLDGEGWAAQGMSDWLAVQPGSVLRSVVQTSPWYGGSYGLTNFGGVVQTTSGAPMSGVTVELIRRTRIEYTTQTDDEGLFSFQHISGTEGYVPVPYTVRLSKEGFVTTREVLVGDEVQTEIRLPQGPRSPVRGILRPEVSSLQGKILGRDSLPLEGAEAELIGADGERLHTATADRYGWYTFADVSLKPSVGYQIRATAEGYLPQSGLSVTEQVLKAEELPTIRLQPARAIVTGTVIGFDGKSVATAAIRLLGQGGSPQAETVSDSDGLYRLEVPLPVIGPVMLAAEREGRLPILLEIGDDLASGRTVSRDLMLFPESDTLEGRLLDEAGAPIDGVRVELLVEGRGVVATTITRGGGRYLFAQVPSMSGWVWLRAAPRTGTFAGSRHHATDTVPLLRLMPGEHRVLNLFVRFD
jgi:hypothetical protein